MRLVCALIAVVTFLGVMPLVVIGAYVGVLMFSVMHAQWLSDVPEGVVMSTGWLLILGAPTALSLQVCRWAWMKGRP